MRPKTCSAIFSGSPVPHKSSPNFLPGPPHKWVSYPSPSCLPVLNTVPLRTPSLPHPRPFTPIPRPGHFLHLECSSHSLPACPLTPLSKLPLLSRSLPRTPSAIQLFLPPPLLAPKTELLSLLPDSLVVSLLPPLISDGGAPRSERMKL